MSKKWPVFMLLKILSFSNDNGSPIKLIYAIIINYQLSIKSAVEFTVISLFSLSACVVPGDIKKVFLMHLLPLSQVADCETTRAVNRLTLQQYVRACKKQSLPLSIPVQKKIVEQKQ